MRLSPTFSFYVARQFLVAFAIALAVIMGIIFLFDVIELIRRASGRGGVGISLLLAMALLKLPKMAHTILPFAVMIGAMISFWRMTRTHELVVARSAGVSVWQFLAPVMIAVFAIGLFEVTVFNPLGAAMYSRFERMQDEVILNRTSALDVSEVGLWLREGQEGGGQMVVHADEVRQEGLTLKMQSVHIFLYDTPSHFTHRLLAERAQLANGTVELEKVWQMEPGKPSVYIETLRLPTQLTLERVQDNFASPEALSFWQLPAFIAFFEKAGFTAVKHRMYQQSLLSSPFLLCGMVLIAAVFSLSPNIRSGGLMMRIGGGVASGFVLYFFSKLVYALGLSATLPQMLAAWSPAMVAGLFGAGVLFHLEDG